MRRNQLEVPKKIRLSLIDTAWPPIKEASCCSLKDSGNLERELSKTTPPQILLSSFEKERRWRSINDTLPHMAKRVTPTRPQFAFSNLSAPWNLQVVTVIALCCDLHRALNQDIHRRTFVVLQSMSAVLCFQSSEITQRDELYSRLENSKQNESPFSCLSTLKARWLTSIPTHRSSMPRMTVKSIRS